MIHLTCSLVAAALAASCASTLVPDPSGAADRLPAGVGRNELVQQCSRCHALGTVVAKRRSTEEWRDTLSRMVRLGAPVDEAQQNAILAYVSTHLTPVAAGASATASATAGSDAAAPVRFERPGPDARWPAYGGGPDNQNFSSLTQVSPGNVASLQPAWTYRYGVGRSNQGDQGLDSRFQVTPLIIGDVMYISTPASPLKPDLKAAVVALRPETGEVLWKYESPANIHGRGLAYWPGDESTAPRLIIGVDGGLIVAIDVTTGRPAQGFGRNGQIDAYVGVASEIVGESRRATFTIPNPVSIYKDLFIAGARPGEAGPPGPRGDIRAFDARTGRLKWAFHVVPQPGEANHDSYSRGEWEDVSGANVWSTMSVDAELGLVFAPTGDLNSDAAGSHLYSSSLLALEAETGKLRWYRQITHRDIWDWDAPTPPLLLDLQKSGARTPAVALVGKHGLFFLFDRRTGAPLNGFSELPTPRADEPSSEVWPTQPFPDAPQSLARTQMTRAEIPDLVPGMRAHCEQFWDANQIVGVPLYAPRVSTKNAVVSYPGPTGGPNWGGGSYNPQSGHFYINVQNRPVYRAKAPPGTGPGMMQRRPGAAPPPTARRPPGGAGGGFQFRTDAGVQLSCGATPWGELVALDVRNLKVAWRAVLGRTEALGEAGRNTGAPNLGGSLATGSGLVFIGATNDRRLRAFDGSSGAQLWEFELEASAHATPVTYMGRNGKQYIVVAAGGGTSAGGPETSDTLVAFTLP